MAWIAGGQIEWKGDVYNYGDEVPDDLVDQYPEWVQPKPITEEEVNSMTKAQLAEALLGAQQQRRGVERPDIIVTAEGEEVPFEG